MSSATYDDLRSYVFPQTDDPEIRARQRMIAEWAVESSPETRDRLIEKGLEKGLLAEARRALRRVLKARGLFLKPDDEARVDACDVLDTLERWLDQAAVATTDEEAIR